MCTGIFPVYVLAYLKIKFDFHVEVEVTVHYGVIRVLYDYVRLEMC